MQTAPLPAPLMAMAPGALPPLPPGAVPPVVQMQMLAQLQHMMAASAAAAGKPAGSVPFPSFDVFAQGASPQPLTCFFCELRLR